MPDASTIAREVMAAIDAADYIRAGALLDDAFEFTRAWPRRGDRWRSAASMSFARRTAGSSSGGQRRTISDCCGVLPARAVPHAGEPCREPFRAAPGTPARLEFTSPLRMVSRRLAAGSRLVLVVAVPKGSGRQINYGTGKAVSQESIADAGEPLVIRWLPGSYLDFPVRRLLPGRAPARELDFLGASVVFTF